MASDKIILTLVIVVSTVIFQALDYQHSMSKRKILSFADSATSRACSVNSNKNRAMIDEIGNETFWKMLRNIYMNYEDHRGNAVEKFIVNRLKKEGEEFWIDRIIYLMIKCEEADLKNEFYIKLLKEMQKQKLTGQYSEYEIRNISYRLEQLYTDGIQGPSSSIIEETVIEAAPVYTTSYRFQFLETFRADMNDFAKFGKYVDALWKDLSTLCINNEFKNANKATFVLDVYIDKCTVVTNGTSPMLLDALMSRFELLTPADLKNKCYIELLKKFQRQKMIGTYSDYEIDNIINQLKKTYADKISEPSL